MKKMNKKGFTIVELVIVIAVIAILAGVMIPTFGSIINKANESEALQEGRALYMEVYAEDLLDGEIDGKVNGTAVNLDTLLGTGHGCTYSVDDDGKVTFKYVGDKATAEFDGDKWTAKKN